MLTNIGCLDFSHEEGDWSDQINGMGVIDQEWGHGQDNNVVTGQTTHDGGE